MKNTLIPFDLGYAMRFWDKFNTNLYLAIIKAKEANKKNEY